MRSYKMNYYVTLVIRRALSSDKISEETEKQLYKNIIKCVENKQ